MYRAGIKYVREFVNEEHERFYTHNEFCQAQRMEIDVVTYYSITKSFPKVWTSILRRDDKRLKSENALDRLNKSTIKWAPQVYSELIHQKYKNDLPHRFLWERDLGIEINDKDWVYVLQNIKQVTKQGGGVGLNPFQELALIFS